MKFGSSALILLLAAPAFAQKPLVLDAALDKGYAMWAVPVKVGDKTGMFLVSFHHAHSGVSRTWLGKDSPEMSVGGMSLGNAYPRPDDDYKDKVGGQTIVGTLGADALSRFAVGFDWGAKKVTLWRKVKPKEAAAFVSGSPARVPLGLRKDGAPTVEATRDGRKLTLALSPWYVNCTLRAADRLPADVDLGKSFAESDKGRQLLDVPLLGTSSLALGPFALAWTTYVPIDDFEADDVQGFYAMHTGAQGRVIVDFPGKALILRNRTRDEEIEVHLTRTLRADVRIEGDAVVIRSREATSRGVQRDDWDGAEVLAMGPLDLKTVVEAMRGPQGLVMVKKLDDLFRAGFEVTVLMDKATRKIGSYTVSPSP